MMIDLFNKGEANFYTCDVTANKQIRENFLIVNQISDDVCVNKTESTLIQRFGTICSSLQCWTEFGKLVLLLGKFSMSLKAKIEHTIL